MPKRKTYTSPEVKDRWNRAHYDRIGLTVYKGGRAEVQALADDAGLSVSEYIRLAIKEKAEKDGKSEFLQILRWSVATHRSTRPQQSDRRPKKEREKKKKRRQKERGRTHWERAESKEPPHIVARGEFFFKKACCPRQGRGLCAGSTGELTPAEHSGAIRARAFRGCDRGVRRCMAMSQYSVLWGCICSLSIASTSLYIRALEGSNPPPPPL